MPGLVPWRVWPFHPAESGGERGLESLKELPLKGLHEAGPAGTLPAFLFEDDVSVRYG